MISVIESTSIFKASLNLDLSFTWTVSAMDGSVQQRKLKLKKVTTTTALSPLALLTLAACGGGGGGGSPTVSGSSSYSVSGNAVAGPIDGAVAFVDYDEDGKLDRTAMAMLSMSHMLTDECNWRLCSQRQQMLMRQSL